MSREERAIFYFPQWFYLMITMILFLPIWVNLHKHIRQFPLSFIVMARVIHVQFRKSDSRYIRQPYYTFSKYFKNITKHCVSWCEMEFLFSHLSQWVKWRHVYNGVDLNTKYANKCSCLSCQLPESLKAHSSIKA